MGVSQSDIVKIVVKTEINPEYLHWYLYNADEELLVEQDTGYTHSNFTYTHEFNFEERQCYLLRAVFEQGGTFRDDGYLEIFVNDSLVYHMDNLWFEKYINFNCVLGESCEQAEVIDTTSFTQKITSGKNYYFRHIPIDSDVYNISACGNDSSIDTEMIIYEACYHALSGTGPEGSSYYSDDGICNPGSSISSALLVSGRSYIIRIRVNEPSDVDSILFDFQVEEFHEGCMDKLACNYDIFADIDDGSCTYGNCLPDLIINETELVNSIYLDTILNTDPCWVEEGCLHGFGRRDIIRFSTHIENIGNADYIVGVPQENSIDFSRNNCHKHWHKLGYAEYLLYKGSGEPVPVGLKNGFCVLDLTCDDNKSYKFSCNYMGISAGCQDIYDASIGCQWVDITDLSDGEYTLVVRINWDRFPDLRGLPEVSYENNWAQACINIDRTSGDLQVTLLEDCEEYTDCLGFKFGQTEIDCEGVCGGSAHYGDMNANLTLDSIDIVMYLQDVVDQDNSISKCSDIYVDGTKSLYDASLLWQCYKSSQVQNESKHFHCSFPRGIQNTFEVASFRLANLTESFVDIEYNFPYNSIMGVSLELEGVEISHFQRLDKEIPTPFEFAENTNNQLHFLDFNEDTFISSNTDFQPLFRVFFSALTMDKVCISKVNEIINGNFEMIENLQTENCVSLVSTLDPIQSQVRIFPTIVNDKFVVSNPQQDLIQVDVFDVKGNLMIRFPQSKISSKEISIKDFQNGVYLVVLTSNKYKSTQKVVKQ